MRNPQPVQNADTRPLHRRVLKTYWSVFLISLVAELVAFYIMVKFSPERVHEYLIRTVAVPTILQITILTACEWAYRKHKESPLLLMLSGTGIAAALVLANLTIHIQVLFLLSILISLFYYDIRQLYLGFVINMSAFMLIFSLSPKMRHSMSYFELFAFLFIMIGMVYILRQAILRGQEILEHLMKMVKSEQELLVKNALMDRMVKRDALTDLYNHKTFHQYLEMLSEASAQSGFSLQLAVIDIDNFKRVNDTYGHAVGDLILARVAKALTEAFTENEIVARYGGEEFAVLFPGKSETEAYAELEAARLSIARMEHVEIGDRPVTVSIGLAGYAPGKSRFEMFDEADALLYKAKRSGKNRILRHAEAEPSNVGLQ